MFAFRCTQKLLRRLRATPTVATPSSTRLGDWYGNLVRFGRLELLLAISEKSRLPVIVPIKEPATVVSRLASAVGDVLRGLGIPEDEIATELHEMGEGVFAPTENRSLLGTLNDLAWMLEVHLEDGASLHELSLRLAETPCSPLRLISPDRATRELFGLPPAPHRSTELH